MHLDEYRRCDLTDLARLLTMREVTADELHEVAYTAIKQVDSELNAVADGPWDVPLPFDRQGPFVGVPFVVKDLVCHPRAVPMRLAG